MLGTRIVVLRAAAGLNALTRAAAAGAAATAARRGLVTRAGQLFVARSGAWSAGGAASRAPLGWGALAHRRGMAISESDVNAEMGSINDLFVEARELIADALDSQGSTYFDDDLEVPPPACSQRIPHSPPQTAAARSRSRAPRRRALNGAPPPAPKPLPRSRAFPPLDGVL